LGVIAFASEETPFASSESFAVLGNMGTLSRDQEEIHYYDPDSLAWHVIPIPGPPPPYIWQSAIRLTQDELSALMRVGN
jgi:hypothetical protein